MSISINSLATRLKYSSKQRLHMLSVAYLAFMNRFDSMYAVNHCVLFWVWDCIQVLCPRGLLLIVFKLWLDTAFFSSKRSQQRWTLSSVCRKKFSQCNGTCILPGKCRSTVRGFLTVHSNNNYLAIYIYLNAKVSQLILKCYFLLF